MSEYTLLLSDGSTISADIEGEISKWVRELLDSGRKVRVRTDNKDVAGHAMSDVLELQLWDDGDTEGHALTLRLPNAEAARDLQKKLLATGALVGVIVVGAGVAQVAPTINISSPDAGTATVQRSVTWDETHSSLRAAPSVAGTRGADWDQAHATGAGSSAVVGGAVNPAQPRENLRTDAHTPLVPPASANPLNRDPEAFVGTNPIVPPASANPLNRDPEAFVGTNPIVPPAAANPLVRDGQADLAPTAPAAAITHQASADSRHFAASSSSAAVSGKEADDAAISTSSIVSGKDADDAALATSAAVSGKDADDAALATSAGLAGKEADDAALATSQFAGKDADDAAITGTAAGDDESSSPPTQAGQWGGR